MSTHDTDPRVVHDGQINSLQNGFLRDVVEVDLVQLYERLEHLVAFGQLEDHLGNLLGGNQFGHSLQRLNSTLHKGGPFGVETEGVDELLQLRGEIEKNKLAYKCQSVIISNLSNAGRQESSLVEARLRRCRPGFSPGKGEIDPRTKKATLRSRQ